MKFGIGIIPQENINNIIKSVKLAEDAGFEYAWIGDYPNAPIFKILDQLADETGNIKIGPGVTNPYFHKPKQIAFEITNLNQLSNNRAVLGIGPGNKDALSVLDIPWSQPATTLKKSVRTIKKSLEKENIPLYIGAQSPSLLEFAAQSAEGVLINASHEKDFEELMTNIKKGFETNRTISDFDVSAYAATSIGQTSQSAINAAKIVVAFIIAGCAPPVLERHNISSKLTKEIYFNLTIGNIGGAISLVNDDLIDIFSVSGTQSEIISKIKNLENVGVTQFIAGSPIGQDMDESIKLLGEVIASF